ncbi:calcium permeable stress-gated cation channel 1-like isoform X2 [Mya arenaria]|uniref:calcium permeable stress-gated cation channel 1-like isoform X2 n=1 Tax=Mya arenaria TaxID=6604 RepID=UPI0022E759B2|nr:calcium permeable stress-gated cation channel 1-like isoform X2 [Mya arenaria]
MDVFADGAGGFDQLHQDGNQTYLHPCHYHSQNKTHFLYTKNEYGGIPETLIINAVAWAVLLVVFAILRRVAWDYGRIALVTRQEENERSVNSSGTSEENKYNINDGNRDLSSMESLDAQVHAQDKGWCSWMVAFTKVKDCDIVKKCGQDAYQYIQFQRYVLLYVLIICVLSTAIIIPVNFTGNNIGNATDFGHTTIANLDAKSNLLWIHGLLCIVYLALAVIFMRHFSVNLKFEADEQVSKTLMVANIPKDKCFKNIIVQHFHGGYPEVSVSDVTFAYDIAKLMELDAKRVAAQEARMNSEIELQKTGHRPTMSPKTCGQCLCCGEACGCVEVDAISFYEDKETRLAEECEREKANAYQRPLGVAFITFDNTGMAERILNDFQPSCKASQNPQPSSIHVDLDVVEWDVSYAPSPENIYWAKLSHSGWRWWLRAGLINGLLIILLFFLTTPTIILSNLDKVNYQDYINKTGNVLLMQFLPTLLLWTFTALLPNLVSVSDQYVGHWTRSSEHHSVMQKTFIFLILMVLILPSLGLTSASALFDLFIQDQGKSVNWGCIFLSGNGAFFVNYIITSAFIGTALELLRFSELFVYGIRILKTRSSAERTSVRKNVLREFQYGNNYAWFLCVFAIIMSYSVSCPLIAPFGLVYMVLKHIIDRYNIYFAYKPSKISPNIHSTAVTYVIIAVIFLQFNFVFFSVIRGSADQPISIFSSVILLVILVVFFGRVCFGCFQSVGPFNKNRYKQFGEESNFAKREDSSQQFVASVLSGTTGVVSTTPSAADTLAHSYGAMETTNTNNTQHPETSSAEQ